MYDFSDGYCPECELAHNKSQMLLNDGDFWECPACHLQAKGGRLSPFFTLLRSRGGGAFRENKVSATEDIRGAALAKQVVDKTGKESVQHFENETELRQFLATVRPRHSAA